MARMKIKEKFPCGYEYEVEASGFFASIKIENNKNDGCPLHGKKCGSPRKKK